MALTQISKKLFMLNVFIYLFFWIAAQFVFPKERKEKLIPKDKMTIIEAEHPAWLNGTRNSPKQPGKRLSEFSMRVQPTPPTLYAYSTSTNGSETKQAVPSGDTSSLSFEVVTTTSPVAAGISIGTSLNNPTVSTVFSPKVKSESDTDTKESTSGEMMQGDQPIIRRHTRQHAHYNGTKKATSSPPRKPPSKLPRRVVITRTMSTVWGNLDVLSKEYQATVTSVLKSGMSKIEWQCNHYYVLQIEILTFPPGNSMGVYSVKVLGE